MDLSAFVAHVTPALTLQLLVSLAAMAAGAVVATYLVLGRKVPPLFAPLGTVPVALVALGTTWWASNAVLATNLPEDVERLTHVALGSMVFALFSIYLPALVLTAVPAAAAALHGPRRWWLVAVGAALATVVVLGPAAGGAIAGKGALPLGALRAVLYLPLALATVVALTSGDPDARGGPEAAVTAAVTLAIAVGVGEASGVATFELFLLPAFANTFASIRPEFVATVEGQLLWPSLVAGWIALGAACGLALVAIGACSSSVRRLALAAPAALGLIAPVVMLLGAGLTVAHWEALSATLPDPAAAAPKTTP